MTEEHVNADVLIVGAGISGLMAATVLEGRGVHVIVLDKSSSVGGRLATRRIGPGVADHGAQFFTARDDEFKTWVRHWMDNNLVFLWSHGWSDGSLNPIPLDGHPRYAVHGGMNALAKSIASGLRDVRVNVHVVTATRDDNGWILQDEHGNLYTSRALIMTAPVPQSLAILDEGATELTREEKAALDRIEYAPCLTGLFWVDGRVTLPQPGAVQMRNLAVTWIADNQLKGISPDAKIITAQASDQYSTQMWNAPDERILNALLTDVQIYLSDDVQVRETQLKRWRYSRPLVLHEERCLLASGQPTLIFAGDAFGGARVEGATLSGLAAGQVALEHM